MNKRENWCDIKRDLLGLKLVQSQSSPFSPPPIGAAPGRAKREEYMKAETDTT